VAVPLIYTQLDNEIRKNLQGKFAEHYAGKQVRVGSAKLIKGRGIEIRGLSIAPYGEPESSAWVYIDEMLAVCSPSLTDLAKDKVQVERVIIRRPRLRATRLADGTWDVAGLLPLPKLGDRSPEMQIESATVDLIDATKAKPCKLTLRDIDLTLTPQVGVDGSQVFHAAGVLGGDYVQKLDFKGVIDPSTGYWRITGGANGISISPEMLADLPIDASYGWDKLPALRARCSLQFAANAPAKGETVPRYRVSCDLSRGRLDDPRLPSPLTDLSAQILCENGLLRVEQLSAQFGQAQLTARIEQQGLSPGSPVVVEGSLAGVQLNRTLSQGLPAALQAEWAKYAPSGEIDIEARLQYDGSGWHPDLTATCKDVAFSYFKFPYRMDRGTGTLRLVGKVLNLEMTAYAEDVPMALKGEVQNLGPQATGWMEVRGNNVEVNRRLIAALPPKAQDVINSLHPVGKFHVYWRGWKNDPTQAKPHQHLILSLAGGTVRYDKLPYPLAQVRGRVEMQDGLWTFQELQGVNDTGFVTCKGRMLPTAEGGKLLELDFAATEVPLEEELRDALQPGVRRVWNELKPRGAVDLTAQVRYLSDNKQFNVTVRVEPLAETTSIEPVALPYRLENVEGVITYRDGKVELSDMRARHGLTQVSARGVSEAHPDGSWYLYFDNVAVDRLHFDRDLLLALPAGLRSVVNQLNPTRPIELRGSFGVAKGAEAYAPLRSRWDLGFYLHQNTVDVGVLLTNVHGMVHLTGNFDGANLRSRGELAIDSVTYNEIQFTEVLGPLWIDNDRVLMGVWAEQEQQRPPRRITAKIYGGALVGDGWVALETVPRFAFQASLSGGDLERFARESLEGQQNLSGTVLGDIQFTGSAQGVNTLAGSGNIRLRNANVYELPMMVQLLKVLRVRVPDATAFDKGDMQFRIVGPHIYLDTINFLGDAISLFGKGEIDFNQQVRLAFHSTVGRNEVPLLRQLVGEASQQIMQIHVRGDLKNPEISNEAFPGVNQVLQQLQVDLQGAPRPSATAPRRATAPPR
jgi:hypothetical protein